MSPSSIRTYLNALAREHRAGTATEHTHRPALKALLEQSLPDVLATNEPQQIACGAPDFVLTRNAIPLGYIEAKNVDKSLDDAAHRAQLRRYVESLDNLIFTNYLEFRFYRDGEMTPVAAVAIGEIRGGKIKPLADNFDQFADLLQTFGAYQGQTITAADDLAKRMAGKARLLARVIEKALAENNGDGDSRSLESQLQAFRKFLIFDISVAEFAGVYAQTIAYGMFAARLHDPAPSTFTRRRAAELIPKSNPFLGKFFGYIADLDLDERIRWIVNDLADIFRATDVEGLMKGFGKTTQRTDPFIHFYETFLGQYDKKLRKGRGVYYTPEPAVRFIVRAVDDILKEEFHLPGGLADTAKTPPAAVAEGSPREFHQVQILEPATGTGTFLAEVIRQVHAAFAGQEGVWSDYVKKELIPRLNGFEILMAPYAMAHLKLEMILRDTGCELDGERLRVFLTNSLEQRHPGTDTLFAQWLADESREANDIKRNVPVMVVMGNPPYAVSSSNKGEWIQALIEDYKRGLSEKKLNLDDDYIKFIRYGEYLIEKNRGGVLAYISNNSFIDGITHRQMRRHLLETFDTIYILNLHGDSRKKERSPDGSPDKNVFDIMQGVSINIFVKSGGKEEGALGEVFYFDLFGGRESKYEFLWGRALGKVRFRKLKTPPPNFFFVPKDFTSQAKYERGFSVKELFPVFNSGVKTDRDSLFINKDKHILSDNIKTLLSGDMDDDFRAAYRVKDSSSYKLTGVIRGKKYNPAYLASITYRPFDARWIYYDREIISRPAYKATRHFIRGANLGLIFSRTVYGGADWHDVLVTDCMVEFGVMASRVGNTAPLFPLYLYTDETQESIDDEPERKPNLNPDIVKTIAAKLGLRFTPEKTDDDDAFAPVDLLDYIYATLHSPAYRKKYREFLKIDFPRVPYPAGKKQFRALARLGAELRALHLMESAKLNTLITTYPQTGDNIVTKPHFEPTDPATGLGKVHINPAQHFAGVSDTAWNFHIGGYQPAQKWLKDRKGRTLTHHDIIHYQKIITALVETAAIMRRVDEVG